MSRASQCVAFFIYILAMRLLLLVAMLVALGFAQTPGESIPWKREGFDPSVLMRGSMPDNFHVHHIFTFGMSANSWGYGHSGGSYTSVMQYDLAPNLWLSAAVGISTTFWSTAPDGYYDPFRDRTMEPDLNIQYIALDWQPSQNVSMRFAISDGSYCDGFFCDPYEPYRRPYRPRGTYYTRRSEQRNAIFR